MSINPYGSPSSYSSIQPSVSPTRGPAIALMVVSILFIVMLFVAMLFELWLITSGTAAEMETRNPLVDSKEQEVALRIGFSIFLMILHSVVLFGAVSMLRMRNLGMAYTAAIISVIPCCSGCYVIGIPFGIWALVVLNNPEVRSRFQ
jgi:hypothetical protein